MNRTKIPFAALAGVLTIVSPAAWAAASDREGFEFTDTEATG
jgi:hypothetical protein